MLQTKTILNLLLHLHLLHEIQKNVLENVLSVFIAYICMASGCESLKLMLVIMAGSMMMWPISRWEVLSHCAGSRLATFRLCVLMGNAMSCKFVLEAKIYLLKVAVTNLGANRFNFAWLDIIRRYCHKEDAL